MMQAQKSYTYPGMTPTLNKMGYMFEDLTEYGEEFIQFSNKSRGPVLELGAAFGAATFKVAACGVKIVANDLEPKHLTYLEQGLLEEQKQFVTTVAGRFPNDLNFSKETFTAVIASNVFHYLNQEEVIEGIKKIFSWLKIGGRAYIIAASPYAYMWQEFIPIFEQRLKAKEPWPGYIEDFSIFKNNNRFHHIPNFMHFFNPEILANVFERYGFHVIKAGFCGRSKWPKDMQLDGRESVGVISCKLG